MSDDSANQAPKNEPAEGQQPPAQPPQAQSPTKVQNQQQQNQFQRQQQQFLSLPGMPPMPSMQPESPLQSADQRFFANYQPAAGVYDEILDANNSLRPHWSKLAEGLHEIGATGMERRWKQIRRMVHQNGIAYSDYGDPAVRERHLQLDPIPQLVPSSQWETIDAALKQRAELLNLMLADLYGPRTLLIDGVLPADILFHHPHYHLPYHGLPTPGGKHMHFYAAELIRSPQGDWWVKADRTGSPGGSGFALENRIVISRTFPDAFRYSNVQQLAPYFIALRNHLTSLAKHNKENPHIAILSAGAGSQGYFEDSFLARYLGFTIVETNDLVVRSGSVMLKTLAGLVPVDVILRRQPGNSLDPLELGGGAPGVPGILQVIRDGNVVVANGPGSGLVESPIFMAFMPRICNALLKTDLLLPGVATFWGGEADSLKLMLDRIDEIHLLPAFRVRTVGNSRPSNTPPDNSNPKSLKPENMSRDERISLLKNNPADWVGQEKVARSSTAVWDEGNLRPGYISMRTFLTASEDSWHSLPGGLVRISNTPYESIRKPFEGAGGKDAWVLADKPVVPTSLLKRSDEVLSPSRRSGFLPSRVADNLLWLGRYLERADASARMVRAVVARLTGENDPQDTVELPILIRALALSGQIDAGYAIEEFSNKLPKLDDRLPKDMLSQGDASSLRSQVGQVVFLAGTVRDRLSNHAWQVVQKLNTNIESSDPKHCDLVDLLDITDTLIIDLAAFSGFVSEFMTRTDAFRFLNIGRRIEHALQIISLIKNCIGIQKFVSGELLESVLEISDSGLTYRSRYYANLQLPAVLDLLLVDELNPRSLAFQISKLVINLGSVPGNSNDDSSTYRQLADEALQSIQTLDIVKICEHDGSGEATPLVEFLEQIEEQLLEVSVSINNRFLVHSGPVNQMIATQSNLPT